MCRSRFWFADIIDSYLLTGTGLRELLARSQSDDGGGDGVNEPRFRLRSDTIKDSRHDTSAFRSMDSCAIKIRLDTDQKK